MKTETDLENGHATKKLVSSQPSSEDKARIKPDPDPVYDADTDVDEDEDDRGKKASPTKSGDAKGGAPDVSLKGRRVLLYGVFNDRCAHYPNAMTIF